MSAVTYTVAFRDEGDPSGATSLTPTFTLYRDIVSLTDLSAPSVVEVGGGHYKFVVDWDTTPESTGPSNHIAFVLDGGASLEHDSERYIVGRIDRLAGDSSATILSAIEDVETAVENVETAVGGVETAISGIEATVDGIDLKVDDIANEIETNQEHLEVLVDVAIGKWEVASNQLKLYSTDGLTVIRTFNLFDSEGNLTSTAPARREPV